MILSLLLLAACSSGSKDSGDVDTDVPSACDASTLPTGDIAIDPDGPLAQSQPWAAWDGEGVRLVWTRPEDDGKDGTYDYDVFTTRIGLDGTILEAPSSLDDDMPGDHIYPRIAVSGSDALAVWQTEHKSGYDEVDLYTRLIGGDTQHLEPIVDGVPFTGNASVPSIAMSPAGGWQVAAAVDYQIVIQPLDDLGNPEGDALIPVQKRPQNSPTLSIADDGSRLVAWEEGTINPRVQVARYAAGADKPESVSSYDYASGPSAAWPFVVYRTQGSEYDIVVRVEDSSLDLGEPGKLDHSPVVAARGDSAMVAWLRNRSGGGNDLVIQEVTWVDGSLIPGDPRILDTDMDVIHYPPTLVPVCDSAWFVAWVEGDGGDDMDLDWVVKGRFF